MAEHTPGPWRVERRAIVAIEAAGHVGPIAEVRARLDLPAHDPDVEATREANAHLIASAPDLLAELENIANADPRQWHEETRDQFQQWAQNRARAAIAKATAAPAAETPDADRIYPCADCGTMRTEAEGGTTFTVCDKCWDDRRAAERAQQEGE